MKAIANHAIDMLIASSVFAFATGVAVAQDPTQVDAKHYKVALENVFYGGLVLDRAVTGALSRAEVQGHDREFGEGWKGIK